MSVDIAALRVEALQRFREEAATYFAQNSEAQSLVLAVAQYWADEANDAAHSVSIAYPSVDPWWPHECGHEEEPGDGAKCRGCVPYTREGLLSAYYLDSNSSAVFAWAAFCSESGANQEGEENQYDPIAIARRTDSGGVDIEDVYEVVRPWLDRNDVGHHREEDVREWGETSAAPEPVRAPWSKQEHDLVAAIVAAPNDVGLRKVLVDHWLERDDVRGEFGALSFDEPKTREARERRNELVAAHGRAWLGPLQPAISVAGAQFARGPFVSRAVVHFRDEAAVEATKDVEEWALLEAIRVVGARQTFNSNMRGLKEVTGLSADGLLDLALNTKPEHIEVLGVTESFEAKLASPFTGVHTLILEDGAVFSDLSWFKNLHTLEVRFRLGFGEFERWRDERAVNMASSLTPKLPPGVTLSVGYQLQNGTRGGVVAHLTAGSDEIRFEDRRFASASERLRAQAHFKARPPVVVEQPGLMQRILTSLRPGK